MYDLIAYFPNFRLIKTILLLLTDAKSFKFKVNTEFAMDKGSSVTRRLDWSSTFK